MRSLVLMLFIVTISGTSSSAQEKCGFGGGDNFAKTQKLLEQAKTCSQATTELNQCAWGSSADNMFASIVVSKCEEEFRKKLTPAAGQRYFQEMRLCGSEYAKQGGTMSISAAALCEANVAASYAAMPAQQTEKPLRASFDCTHAQSEIEKAICSDQQLGDADIVLSRVYDRALRQPDFKFSSVLQIDQRDWLKRLPTTCDVPHSTSEILPKCLLREYENRFSMIDVCTEGALNETSWSAKQYIACLKDTSSLSD